MKKILLVLIFPLSLIVGIIGWKVGLNLQSWQINVTGIYHPSAGGNPCGLLQLYDLQGLGHGFYLTFNRIESEYAYVGTAPLYGFSLYDPRINSPDPENCVWTESIDPNIVKEGQTFYPLNFHISLSSLTEKIKQGESFELVATAEFSDVFTKSDANGNFVFAYPIAKSEKVTGSFELATTTFEVSPSFKSENIEFRLTQPSEYSWIISPKEKALGSQQINVLLNLNDSNGEQTHYESEVHLDVVDISGINPYLLGITSALITLIGGFFTILKLIPESLATYKKLMFDKTKKRKTMGIKTNRKGK